MTTASESANTSEPSAHGHAKPHFRGFIHLLAFSSALTLAPILIVVTPGVAERFIMAIYGLAVVGLVAATVGGLMLWLG